MSCICVFYLPVSDVTSRPVIADAESAPLHWRATSASAIVERPMIPTRSTPGAKTLRARSRPQKSGSRDCSRMPVTSSPRGSWHGRRTGSARRVPTLSGGRHSSRESPAGRAATKLEPNRPEGHMWLAANMGALAESFGLRQGLKYRGEIKSELETVLRIDPAFQQGSADRALGRWYYKVPGLFGGSNTKSEEHLRKSLTYNPNSTASLYFLAETLIAVKKKAGSERDAGTLACGADRPGLGRGGSRFQEEGAATDGGATLRVLASINAFTVTLQPLSRDHRRKEKGVVFKRKNFSLLPSPV